MHLQYQSLSAQRHCQFDKCDIKSQICVNLKTSMDYTKLAILSLITTDFTPNVTQILLTIHVMWIVSVGV